MNEEIERAPYPPQLGKDRVQCRDILDVTGQHEVGIDRRRGWLDALSERPALRGESQLSAGRGNRLGYPPGDRVMVGDPHDQAALALHQFAHPATHTLGNNVFCISAEVATGTTSKSIRSFQ